MIQSTAAQQQFAQQIPAPAAVQDGRWYEPVYCFFGYGQGGEATSFGMDFIASDAKKLSPRVVASEFDWNQWQTVAQWIRDIHKARPYAKLCICGFSLSGDAVTWIEYVTGVKIDLLIAMDPSTWTTVAPLLPTVQRAVLFHDDNPLNLVGHAELIGAKKGEHNVPALGSLGKAYADRDFDPKRLVRYVVHDLHLSVPLDPWIKQIILAEIKALLEQP